MPYTITDVKSIDDTRLSLDQVDAIVRMADAIGGVAGEALAISNFKRAHVVKQDKWVETDKEEIQDIYITKENGRYNIVGISTAAVRDKDDETFSVEAIDYDILQVKESGDYPEFRMFHKPYLAIGKVTNMRRAGIFAIDSGVSYDDPFSLAVCKMLEEDKSDKWRMSRGFIVLETSGGCPECSEQLLLRTKHMLVGYKCPSCGTYQSEYKGVLKDLHFRKVRTFDVTVTDIPCLPYTGVTAYRELLEVPIMNKKQLREKLVDAGLEDEIIDERLKQLTDVQLKSMDDLPFAHVLKEVLTDEDEEIIDEKKEDVDGDEQLFVLDPEVLEDFAKISKEQIVPVVKETVSELLDGLEIDIGDVNFGDAEMEVKEIPELSTLSEEVAELKEMVQQLVQDDEERLKELYSDAPRGAKFRIMRQKCDTKKKGDEEDEEDEDEITEEKQREGVIVGSDGKAVDSMTEFIRT